MSEPKFKRGDVVKHRASGEKAIVVSPLMGCVKDDHQHPLAHMNGFRADCILEFAGSYRVDPGFMAENFDCNEDWLESIEH